MKRPLTVIGSIATSLAMLPSMAFAQSVDASVSSSVGADTSFFETFLGSVISDNTNDAQDPIFDVQEFRAHPCYDVKGEGEVEYCLDLLGISDDDEDDTNNGVSDTFMAGLGSWLNPFIQDLLDDRCARFFEDARTRCMELNDSVFGAIMAELHQSDFFNASWMMNGSASVLSEEDEDLDDDDDDDTSSQRHMRATRAWELCSAEGSRMQARCFRNARRFINDNDMTLLELEDMIDRRSDSGGNDDDTDNDDDDMNDDQDEDDTNNRDDNDDEDMNEDNTSGSNNNGINY